MPLFICRRLFCYFVNCFLYSLGSFFSLLCSINHSRISLYLQFFELLGVLESADRHHCCRFADD